MNEPVINCTYHPLAPARHFCQQCQTTLCHQCVSKENEVTVCNRCRQSVYDLFDDNKDSGIDKRSLVNLIKEAATSFVNHVLIPLAIIAMVSAFFFYLLDIRSLYYPRSFMLKRLGFFFTVATVFIVRYIKVYGSSDRNRFYTMALVLATFFATLRSSLHIVEAVFNLGIIFIIWRFATNLTSSLHMDEERKKEDRRMYGLERIEFEQSIKKLDIRPRIALEMPSGKNTKKENPEIKVSRMAFLAIGCFALGEPLILSASPEVGIRAFTAVVIFILATGIVLTASSSMTLYRQTIQSGGRASLGMIPGKIFVGFILLVAVLSLVMSFPFIHYKGTGVRQEKKEFTSGMEKSSAGEKDKYHDQKNDEAKEKGDENVKSRSKANDRQQAGENSFMQSLFNFLQSLGKWLIIPVVIILFVLIVYFGFKLSPLLKHLPKKIFAQWQALWKKIKSIFRYSGGMKAGEKKVDILKLLKILPSLPPREAILAAYQCMLALFSQFGYKPNVRLTPFEYLYSIPGNLAFLTSTAREITDLYVQVAYGSIAVSPESQRRILLLLGQIRELQMKYLPKK